MQLERTCSCLRRFVHPQITARPRLQRHVTIIHLADTFVVALRAILCSYGLGARSHCRVGVSKKVGVQKIEVRAMRVQATAKRYLVIALLGVLALVCSMA